MHCSARSLPRTRLPLSHRKFKSAQTRVGDGRRVPLSAPQGVALGVNVAVVALVDRRQDASGEAKESGLPS